MVTEYLESGRAMDKAFVDRYIQTYETRFPAFLVDLEHVLGSRYVLAMIHSFATVAQKFPTGQIPRQKLGISASAISAMAKVRVTKVVMIAADHRQAVDRLKQGLSELYDWNPNAETDFTNSRLLKDKTYLIVVNSVTQALRDQLETLTLKQ
jgi:hypothetical protein